MRTQTRFAWLELGLFATLLATPRSAAADADDDAPGAPPLRLSTGQFITPRAPRGAVQLPLNPGLPSYPGFVAGEAVRSQLSPDGTTLAILCAGQNSLAKADGTTDEENTTQYIFLYDVTGANRGAPMLSQVLRPKNAHVGLIFAPDGRTLYAAGGADDVVYAYTRADAGWSLARAIPLGHGDLGVGVDVRPNASGLGISADGQTLVVANNYNDSVSVIDLASGSVRYEYDLRPYAAGNEGTPGGVGGTFPFAVVIKGNTTAYVSSERNREVIALELGATSARLIKRIPLEGNALGMTLDPSALHLYVAQDNADRVAVINTSSNDVVSQIDARAPAGMLVDRELECREPEPGEAPRYTGAGTFSVTLAPDGKTLYAVNAGANSIAVIPLLGEQAQRVSALIPTAYEPHDITFSSDGAWMYVINGKSVTGANPQHLAGNTASITSVTYPGGNAAAAAASDAANQYQFQLERASLVAAPVPRGDELDALTRRVAANNFYGVEPSAHERDVVAFLRQHIQHVIYIVKENRTFDQILGDLGNGSDGDPTLTQFGEGLTPNHHRLARRFVTLDNFMDPGDGSMDGWSWSLQGRVTNMEAITQQINYSFIDRGLSYESEGTNRNVPVALASTAERDAVSGPRGTTLYSEATAMLPGGTENLLTGTANHATTDAPFGIEGGYIFSAVLRAGGTVRNYGFLVNNIGDIGTIDAPISDPFAASEVQVGVLEPSLVPLTDLYFRGYDQAYPDLWRYDEWKREFDAFVKAGDLPSLSLVRLSHDHMGSFDTALGGVNTPETQQADNDLAVGLLVQAVSESPFADSTLILITEDDCQDGPDHVDSHRATAYVVGPYVKRRAIVSEHYNQVNVLRTIEDILGTSHLNMNTAFQKPMTEVFDIRASGRWAYEAVASTVLETTSVARAPHGRSVRYAKGPRIRPKHDAAYWAKATAAFDFSQADRVPAGAFNRVIWNGSMDGKPYPSRGESQLATRDDD